MPHPLMMVQRRPNLSARSPAMRAPCESGKGEVSSRLARRGLSACTPSPARWYQGETHEEGAGRKNRDDERRVGRRDLVGVGALDGRDELARREDAVDVARVVAEEDAAERGEGAPAGERGSEERRSAGRPGRRRTREGRSAHEVRLERHGRLDGIDVVGGRERHGCCCSSWCASRVRGRVRVGRGRCGEVAGERGEERGRLESARGGKRGVLHGAPSKQQAGRSFAWRDLERGVTCSDCDGHAPRLGRRCS